MRLLALIADGLGAETEDYEPPGVRLRDWLDGLAEPDPAERRLRIAELVDAGIGDLTIT